jgi:regulator of protease activity HflC (stomatin/prohibitin superfamily)
MVREKAAGAVSGWAMGAVWLALLFGSVFGMISSGRADHVPMLLAWLFAMLVALGCLCGLFVVNPNEGRVVQLFGDYVGTEKRPGLWWTNPLTTRRRVSLRIRNFESAKLKVNDHDGNPIEIAAIVVWRVVETAEAMFHVDNYDNFVHVQTESALRNLATAHPYDAHEDGQMSLRGNTAEIADGLRIEIQARLTQAGIEVIESRISHLAYAQEIAGAMLRRQQASAVIAARAKIVAGAVGMVEMALDELSKKAIVVLDDERKAAMVSNLLVVLCSEQQTHPVINAGTLYTA